jgi:hypothetical protein
VYCVSSDPPRHMFNDSPPNIYFLSLLPTSRWPAGQRTLGACSISRTSYQLSQYDAGADAASLFGGMSPVPCPVLRCPCPIPARARANLWLTNAGNLHYGTQPDVGATAGGLVLLLKNSFLHRPPLDPVSRDLHPNLALYHGHRVSQGPTLSPELGKLHTRASHHHGM